MQNSIGSSDLVGRVSILGEIFKILIMYCQLQICIDASVDINILIPKYKGEGKEGCGLSETFFIQIKESTKYFHWCKCWHRHPHSEVQRWRKIKVRHVRDICYAHEGINYRFELMQVLALTSSFWSTKVKEKKGVACQRNFLCRSRSGEVHLGV